MKNIPLYNLMSFMLSLSGLITGAYTIIILKKFLTFKVPPNFNIAQYHEWLSNKASIGDLRTLAVTGDDAIRALCSIVLILAILLIAIGIFNAIFTGYDMYKKAAK